MKPAKRAPKFQYLIARNKITRLVDVIAASTGEVVSAGHKDHDDAETFVSRFLLRSPQENASE